MKPADMSAATVEAAPVKPTAAVEAAAVTTTVSAAMSATVGKGGSAQQHGCQECARCHHREEETTHRGLPLGFSPHLTLISHWRPMTGQRKTHRRVNL
jgi:hypothetical protein